MKAVRQQHLSGCAIACVASVLKISYKKALKTFEQGSKRAKFRGFYCSEIVQALQRNGQRYSFKYIKKKKKYTFTNGTIVFLQKNSRYPAGHFVCKTPYGWMDSWINFPQLSARAGFRKRLPGKVIYLISVKS